MVTPARRPRRRIDEVRTAIRRASAITVFVAALALTSPPAAAPTDREPAGPFLAAVETDPLLGPWPVEQFLTPPAQVQDFPAAQHGGTASTPAAVLPAAGVRTLWAVRRAQAAALTAWELMRHGSAALRISLRWLQHAPLPEAPIHQSPLPVPSWDVGEPPILAPGAFNDILDFQGTLTLRSGLLLPMASANSIKGSLPMHPHPFLRDLKPRQPGAVIAAQTRSARPRDGPHRFAAGGATRTR